MRNVALLLMSISVALTACQAAPLPSSAYSVTDAANGWKHYRDDEFGFVVEFPSDVDVTREIKTPTHTEYHSLWQAAQPNAFKEGVGADTRLSLSIVKLDPSSSYNFPGKNTDRTTVEGQTWRSEAINNADWELISGALSNRTQAIVTLASPPQKNNRYRVVLWGIVPSSEGEAIERLLKKIAATVVFDH
jgi:hypothetical protein